jgi:hypothetical protein
MGNSVSPGPNGAGDSVGASAISRTYINWKAHMNIRLLRSLGEPAVRPGRKPSHLEQPIVVQVMSEGQEALPRPRSSQP